MFDALTSRMSRTLAGLRSRGRINPVDLESTLGEIRTALLEADVALTVVEQLITEVRRRGLSDFTQAIWHQPSATSYYHHS